VRVVALVTSTASIRHHWLGNIRGDVLSGPVASIAIGVTGSTGTEQRSARAPCIDAIGYGAIGDLRACTEHVGIAVAPHIVGLYVCR